MEDFFPAGVPFSTENLEGTVLKSLFREYKTQYTIYTKQNTKYANQNTKYANQKFMLFCREAIFVANLRTFLAYFLQAKKYGGVPKRTNMRYEHDPPSLALWRPALHSRLQKD